LVRLALGRSNIHLSNIANTTDGKIGVRVYISNKIASAALPQLEAERSAIESELGEKLEWNPNPEASDKVIKLERTADLNDRNRWPEYLSWLVDNVDKFKKTFGPRVKDLKLDQMPTAPSALGH
jgi:predicted Zn-dependent protease